MTDHVPIEAAVMERYNRKKASVERAVYFKCSCGSLLIESGPILQHFDAVFSGATELGAELNRLACIAREQARECGVTVAPRFRPYGERSSSERRI